MNRLQLRREELEGAELETKKLANDMFELSFYFTRHYEAPIVLAGFQAFRKMIYGFTNSYSSGCGVVIKRINCSQLMVYLKSIDFLVEQSSLYLDNQLILPEASMFPDEPVIHMSRGLSIHDVGFHYGFHCDGYDDDLLEGVSKIVHKRSREPFKYNFCDDLDLVMSWTDDDLLEITISGYLSEVYQTTTVRMKMPKFIYVY